MSEEVKGVFVRLPLSDEQITVVDAIAREIAENNAENEWRFARHHFSACDDLILTLGTPVMGDGLEVMGYSAKLANSFNKTKGEYTTFDIVPRLVSHSIHIPIGSAKEIHPLVRQSDALAALAQRDAEIARLREALRWITYTAHDLPEFMRVEIMLEWAEKALKGPEA